MSTRNIKYDRSPSFPRPPKADPPPAEKRESRVCGNRHQNPGFQIKSGMTKMALAVFIFFGIVFSSPVHAQQNLAQQPCYSDRGGYCIKIVAPKNAPKNASVGFAIVGLEFLGESAALGDLLANLYYFLFGLVGISALVMFVWGGIEYMLAGDKDPSEAKKRMKNAVFGLVLALTSWLILYTINPDLVSRLDINLDPITPQQRTDQPPSSTIPPPDQIPQ